MSTNKILVVGAMVVSGLVATGCNAVQDAAPQDEGTSQVQAAQAGTEACDVAANRFGAFHGRGERFGRAERGRGWGRGRGRDHDRRGWWDRARFWR